MNRDTKETFQPPPITLPEIWPADIRTQVEALIAPLYGIILKQQELIEQLRAENAELKRLVFGRKSERIPDLERLNGQRKREQQTEEEAKHAHQQSLLKRKENGEKKRSLPVVEHRLSVDPVDLHCPSCGGNQFRQLGEGEVSYEYEYMPAHFVRHKHIQEKWACRCGQCVITAPAPKRVSEGVQYGPGFHAQVVVARCADSTPLYRQTKQLNRLGIPVSRSTLGDLFHRSASLLKVLWVMLVEMIAQQDHVNADETRQPAQAKNKTHQSYIWTFVSEKIVVYVYSPSRSGETPLRVLGNSQGVLQVDAYSGYNHVTTPGGRQRAGCLGHTRRYFFKAKGTAPEQSQWVMEQVLKLYQVEYRAVELDILGTEKHLALRQAESKPLMAEWSRWLETQKPLHTPKSPMGEAITYAQNNWTALSVFLTDAKVALDNNISERALKVIALGRKNSLFVGNDVAGEHLAILQTLVGSCEINDINPLEYLTDVLIRIQDHPMNRLEELLPQNWKPLGGAIVGSGMTDADMADGQTEERPTLTANAASSLGANEIGTPDVSADPSPGRVCSKDSVNSS